MPRGNVRPIASLLGTRFRLTGNNHPGNLAVRSLWNDVLSHKVRLGSVRTPIDDLLRVNGPDSGQGSELFLRSRVDVEEIRVRRRRAFSSGRVGGFTFLFARLIERW